MARVKEDEIFVRNAHTTDHNQPYRTSKNPKKKNTEIEKPTTNHKTMT